MQEGRVRGSMTCHVGREQRGKGHGRQDMTPDVNTFVAQLPHGRHTLKRRQAHTILLLLLLFQLHVVSPACSPVSSFNEDGAAVLSDKPVCLITSHHGHHGPPLSRATLKTIHHVITHIQTLQTCTTRTHHSPNEERGGGRESERE